MKMPISLMQNETSLFYFKFYILFPVRENFVIITIISSFTERILVYINRIYRMNNKKQFSWIKILPRNSREETLVYMVY